MSAGFDACNLDPSRLDFISGASSAPGNSPLSGGSHAAFEEKASIEKAIRPRAEALPQRPAAALETRLAKSSSEPPTQEPSAQEQSAQEPAPSAPRKLQRIAEARQQQGFSLRTISRRTGVDLRTLRSHELPTADLKLSELRAWQAALEVPLVDLIEDDLQPLSSPVKDRALLVRIMKTVVALKEAGGSLRHQRLADMLFEQMVELMPELAEVGGWPQHGSRRSSGSSRIIEQQVNTRAIRYDGSE